MSSRPVATLVAIVTAALGLLTALVGTGALSGRAAAWAVLAIAILNGLLGVAAHQRVTPLANPRDARGRPLIAPPRRD